VTFEKEERRLSPVNARVGVVQKTTTTTTTTTVAVVAVAVVAVAVVAVAVVVCKRMEN